MKKWKGYECMAENSTKKRKEKLLQLPGFMVADISAVSFVLVNTLLLLLLLPVCAETAVMQKWR